MFCWEKLARITKEVFRFKIQSLLGCQSWADWYLGTFPFDGATFEVQVPVTQDPNNAFTGGNTFFPRFALLPQVTWYGSAKVRLRSFFLRGSITNSMGDYTFSRLSSWPANLLPVNIPLPVPYGPGNELRGFGCPW
jgi:hypothetical protein